MQKTYAVICARGGSKRVPGKNLAMLAGRPILEYTVAAARECGLFDDIVVNSDSEVILEVAAACGATSYRRPEALAGDKVFLIDVLREMIAAKNWPGDAVIAVLFPTAPLRAAQDIVKAHDLFMANGGNTPVVSVTPYEYPIQTALRLNEAGRLIPAMPEAYARSTRHNDHETSYRATYAVIFNTAANFLTQRKLIGVDPIPCHLPPERSIDIDEPFQLLLAELLLKHGMPHERDG